MASDSAPTWQVVAQREDIQANPNGQGFTSGVVITFKVASGATGSVFIPDADYSVERAREAIGAKATAMEAVGQLQG